MILGDTTLVPSASMQPFARKNADERFVGRWSERSSFDARLDDALRRDGSLTLLRGAAGIGKTSMLHVWMQRARERGFAVAHVTNYPFAHEPYAPIAELCRTLARADPRALPRGEQRSLFVRFLDLLPPGEESAAESWQKRRLFVLVREFLERVAASGPIVLSIDDAHWLDPESLEVLQYLAPYLGDMRAVVVLSLRPDAGAPAEPSVLERHPACYCVELGPLGEGETRELVYALLPGRHRLAQRTIGDICALCADTPLFAEEYVRAAVAGNPLPAIPPTVEQSVNDILGRFEPDDAALLEAAAAAGPRIDGDLLTALFGRSAEDIARVLRAARDAGVLVDRDESGELAFGHEFVRAAMYARLTAEQRRTHHTRIVAHLQTARSGISEAELYHHMHGSGDAARAAAIAERAGDEARERLAFATAREFFEAALAAMVFDASVSARVDEKLGECYDVLGSHAEAAACFERVEAFAHRTHDREREAASAIRLALAAGRLSDRVAEARHCARALACSGGRGPHAFAAEVLLALHFANSVDPDLAETHLLRADALAGDRDGAFAVRHRVARAAIANLRADVDAWRNASFEAVAAAEKLGDPALLANVWSYVADFARVLGEPELARRGFAAAVESADAFGLTFTAAKTRLAAADMAFTHGRMSEAHRFVREAAALQADGAYAGMQLAAVGLPVALAVGDAFLCDRLDDPALLETLLLEEPAPLAVSCIAAHVELRVRRGDDAGARALVARTLPRVRHAAFIDSALLAFARFGDAEDARTAATLLAGTVHPHDAIAAAHVPLAAAFAAERANDANAVRRCAEEARERAIQAGTPRLHAMALELAGSRDAALQIFADCGAHGDVQRLAGARKAATSRDASDLTRRETEVAKLVAAGLSNRAIAERLSLSERTVEHHAGAIFGKLGIRSRAQLTAFMSRSTP